MDVPRIGVLGVAAIAPHALLKPARERVPGKATYTYQLEAFRDAVRDGGPVLTDAADAVRTMTLIDDAYRAAGLQPRQPAPVPADRRRLDQRVSRPAGGPPVPAHRRPGAPHPTRAR